MNRLALAVLASTLLAAPAVAGAAYSERDEAQAFVRDMAQRHGFDSAELHAALDRAQHDERVIRLITPPATPAARSWQRYRAGFLDTPRLEGGLAFWRQHEAALTAAHERFGVPPEIVVAIIGVETLYGRNTGKFETVSALATLAFDYPPRAPLFLRELENLFLLAREQGRDPFSYQGSYAGALGYPQFLPSSIRSYAIDFDGNGRTELVAEPVDAIGSIANYMAVHGWQRDAPVAIRARLDPDTDPAPLVQAGIEPTLSPELLTLAGIAPLRGPAHDAPATLVDLATPDADTEYWLGYRNFYVITRYNKSSFYAMAVFELARALRERREASPPGSP